MRPQLLVGKPTVSVVVPCYNYGHYLPAAVASILAQTGVETEVTIVDDASPDGSAEVAKELAAANPRVRAILHQRNKGHIATYNDGLEQAEGTYVVLLSADDLLPSGSLARATALMEAVPSVGLVYGHPLQFQDQPPAARERVRDWTIWEGRDWIERRCRRGDNCTFNSEVVMRTAVQRQIGGYDPTLPHSGDLEMWLRAATVSDIGRVNGAVQGFYRSHDKSMQHTVFASHLADWQGRHDAFESVLAHCETVPGSSALYQRACRSLAVTAIERVVHCYDHDRADQESLADYISFALNLWPGIEGTQVWRRMNRRASATKPPPAVVAHCRRLGWDVGDRIRYRRWRWTGV